MTKVKCLKCGDIIEGDKKGTFLQCSCKSCYIDETKHYCRIGGRQKDIEVITPEMELLEYINSDEVYKKHKEGKLNNPSDFEKFCVNHCNNIADVLSKNIKLGAELEQYQDTSNKNKELISILNNLEEFLKGIEKTYEGIPDEGIYAKQFVSSTLKKLESLGWNEEIKR